MAEENEEEPRLSERARAMLAASRREDLGISFRPGGPAAPADAAERELVEARGRELSYAALESIAAGAEEIERALEGWTRERELDPRGRAEAGRYWHSQLPFVTAELSVDDAAYLAALAKAAVAPSPEEIGPRTGAAGAGRRDAALAGWMSKVASCDSELGRRKLAAAGERQPPSALADAMLRAEGALGADPIMPPPVRAEMLPAREKLLEGMLAGAPAWLWRKTAAGEPSPVPVPPPEWMSGPAHDAFEFRRAARAAASAAIDDGAECAWAAGCKTWAQEAERAWERGTYDARAAFAAAPAVDAEAAEAAVDVLAAGAIRSSGTDALAACLAATLAGQAAAKIPTKTRARAPDAKPQPLTAERMAALIAANPVKPYF